MTDSKYYWLKLKRDFFKRHDIRIVEGMPNGKEYILFYLKLLCESVDHEGSLRFSDQIPYNEDMLAIITNTNVDIVRSAVKVFTELKMMEILDDGTIFMSEVEGMIGSASNTDNANRQRRFRERQKALELTENDGIACIPVTEALRERYESVTKNNESKSIEIDIEKEKDIDSKKRKRFIPPTLEEVKSYCSERKNNVDANKFIDYYESNGWMVGRNKMKDWKAAVRSWERNNYGSPKQQSHVVEEVPDYMRKQIDEIDSMYSKHAW